MPIAIRTITMAIMIASRPLTLSDQMTIQMQSPAVAVRIKPMGSQMLTERGLRQRRREAGHQPANRGRGVRGLPGGAHEPGAHDDPVGAGPRRGRRVLRG